MPRREREATTPGASDETVPRPRTRAECANVPRPCPFISCKHHLYLDVSPRTGSIKLNFPDLEVWQLPISCALDIAEAGGCTLETVGQIMNLTRERVRQMEVGALSRLEAVCDMVELRELTVGPVPVRRVDQSTAKAPGPLDPACGEPRGNQSRPGRFRA